MNVKFYRYESSRKTYSNVSDVLDGDELDQVEELESEFCSYIGSKYALATSNGTAALHLAMLALDLKRGDKILCSVNAHPNVAEVVRHFDAEPLFVDIDPLTYNIDLNALESYLASSKNKKLKAVIVTHIAGQSVDLHRLYDMAKRHKIRVVEDAQNALGATYDGIKIGSSGADITCFSFSSHLKPNACNGGMLVSSNEEFLSRAKLLRSHGIDRDERSPSYVYDVIDIGFDYRMSQLDAAYIRAHLDELDENIAKTRAIAQRYNKELGGVDHISLPYASSDEHLYSNYIITVDKNRDSFALELKKEGVEVGLHYIPLHFLSYYKTKYNLRLNDYPNALQTYQKVMSLPIYSTMSSEEVEFVIKKVKAVASTRV